MTTTRVTITMDEGTYRDAADAAAEHGMSVSAWITRCTQLETTRDALARHQDWCAAEGLTGAGYEDRHARVITGAAAELDRAAEARRQADAA